MQSPEVEVELFERVFRRQRQRDAVTLREDFCGSASLCAEWARSDDAREAVGVDLDRQALAWSVDHVLAELDDDERDRVSLVCGDVRTPSKRTFDLICAGNFSWAILDHLELPEYLRSARACLEDDGVLALEIFGGSDLRRPLVHEHPQEGFSYVWEQESVVQDTLRAAIHFRVGRRWLRRAFQYSFQLRSLEQSIALLRDAGFASVDLYVEASAARFRRVRRTPRRAAWNGYLFAWA